MWYTLGLVYVVFGLCDHGYEFCCSKLGLSKEFGFEGRHGSGSGWFGGKERSFGKRLGYEM